MGSEASFPLGADLLDRAYQLPLLSSRAGDGVREPRDPGTGPAESVLRQPRRVATDVGSEADADRRRCDQLQPTGQQPGGQDATDSPVTVGERVDELELRVGDGGLCDG